jgi:glycosyltransferase involved in cell wall biosynthesis
MSSSQATTPPLADALPSEDEIVVSVVIPCLNEEENIEECVRRARAAMDDAGIAGEVVVADNASEDRSAELAAAAGARVVSEPRRGYGSAYLAGFAAARGRYIVMGDADLTYDFHEIPRFVEQLDAVAPPLRRQPDPHRHPQPLLPHRRLGRALRHARAAAGHPAPAGPAHHRDGVRLGDGHPGLQGEARHP